MSSDNPFYCGPNPCEWPCRPVVPPVSCVIFEDIFNQDWSKWTVIRGTWTENPGASPTNVQTNSVDALALSNTVPTTGVVFSALFNTQNGDNMRIFIKSNATGTEYMYADIRRDAFNNLFLAIGTEGGELASLQITVFDWLADQRLTVCYDPTAGLLVGSYINQFGSIADVIFRVDDNGHNHVGIGTRPTGLPNVEYLRATLNIHKSIDYPDCPECARALDCIYCEIDKTPLTMIATIDGLANGTCLTCGDYDGNFLQPYVPQAGQVGGCGWVYQVARPADEPCGVYDQFNANWVYVLSEFIAVEDPPFSGIFALDFQVTYGRSSRFPGGVPPGGNDIIGFWKYRVPNSESLNVDCVAIFDNGPVTLTPSPNPGTLPEQCDWLSGSTCTVDLA